jgi:putative sigma-54 modulation protein
MNINIKATNIELTPAISDYVDRKINSVYKYLETTDNESDIIAQVEVGKTTNHHKAGEIFRAEVHISGSGLNLYAVAETEDLYASIDKVRDEIANEVKRNKEKRFALARRGGQMVKDMMRGVSSQVRRFKIKGFKKNESE